LQNHHKIWIFEKLENNTLKKKINKIKEIKGNNSKQLKMFFFQKGSKGVFQTVNDI
jgi:hypothetical protein